MTAVRARSPANANGWPLRRTDRYESYAVVELRSMRENVLGA